MADVTTSLAANEEMAATTEARQPARRPGAEAEAEAARAPQGEEAEAAAGPAGGWKGGAWGNHESEGNMKSEDCGSHGCDHRGSPALFLPLLHCGRFLPVSPR